tara:strand:+ start:158 stop:619 length:462 start_codon:yes stop_codon:yes gene_type:complete
VLGEGADQNRDPRRLSSNDPSIMKYQITVTHWNKPAEVFVTNDKTHEEALASAKMLQNSFPSGKVKIERGELFPPREIKLDEASLEWATDEAHRTHNHYLASIQDLGSDEALEDYRYSQDHMVQAFISKEDDGVELSEAYLRKVEDLAREAQL